MSEQELRQVLARNLSAIRRQCGMTQSELAECINYSDKSISKWERGEGLPDLYILTRLADIYGVRVQDFLQSAPPAPPPRRGFGRAQRLLITALSVGLVWLVDAVAFFVLRLLGVDVFYLELAVFSALFASTVVLTVFSALWFSRLWCGIAVSSMVWLSAGGARFFVTMDGIEHVFWIAGALQILVILWYVFIGIRSENPRKFKKEKVETEK